MHAMNIQIPDPELAGFFQNEEAFLVGGTVRDILLGRDPVDYDIVAARAPAQVAESLARELGGRLVVLGKPGLQVFRIVTPGRELDVAPLLGRSIEADLGSRDFTINAMAVSLGSGRLIDPFGGRQDLARKRIRVVRASAFQKDPLRMVRTYRFGAGLSFAIDPDTQAAVARFAGLIRQSAGERIKAELFKLLGAQVSFPYLRQAAKTGLLWELFPGLGPLARMPGEPSVPQAGLRMLAPFERLEQMLAGDFPLPAPWEEVRNGLSSEDRALLKLGMLFPVRETARARAGTRPQEEPPKRRPPRDPLLEAACQRLKCASREIRFLQNLQMGRRTAGGLWKAFAAGRLDPLQVTRFFMRQEEAVPMMLLAFRAAGDESPPPGTAEADRFAEALLDQFYGEYQPRRRQPPLLSGRDLIRSLGLPPSPLFAPLLDRVEEARLSGRIHTREQALSLARRILDLAGEKDGR